MDFVFRGFRDQRTTSSIRPPSSFYAFRTAQQCNNGSSSGVGGRDHFIGNRAAMVEREFEKEMIREQILAEEEARRCQLEAEVRREIMVERELELRRRAVVDPVVAPLPYASAHYQAIEHESYEGRIVVPIQERSHNYPMVGHPRIGGFEDEMPFQRAPQPRVTEVSHPVDVWNGKEKQPSLLAKTDANLLGTKRKAALPPSSSASRKKYKEDWSCALCQISTTDERGLTEHLQGKKHKANASRLISQKTGKTGLGSESSCNLIKHIQVGENTKSDPTNKDEGKSDGAATNLTPLGCANTTKDEASLAENNTIADADKESGKAPQKTEVDKRKNLKFWCEMCQKGADTLKVMNRHMKGKQHVLSLNKLKGLNGVGSSN